MIQRTSSDLVLIYSDVKFTAGALLTPKAYADFLAGASESETKSHTATLVDPETAKSMKLETFTSLGLH